MNDAVELRHRVSNRMAEHLSVDCCRVRDAVYAAELLGLRLDVPWSIWDGYEGGGPVYPLRSPQTMLRGWCP